MNEQSQNAYAARIQRVIEYIESNLEYDLSVERLSAVAGFSKFHFHRLFSLHTGTTVGKLTRQLRLKRATWDLAFAPEKKVIEVALSAGFSNPETFARAFKSEQGQSPSEFRREPRWRDWNQILVRPKKNQEIKVKAEFINFPSTQVAALEHLGPPGKVMDTVSRFINWRRQSTASPEATMRTFGLIYSDPESTKAEEFRFDVCGELRTKLEINQSSIVEKTIAGGRCARAQHVGSLDVIAPVVRELYRSVLSNGEEQLRDFPCFFHYKKRMPDVSEHEQVTDIYLPLQ